MSVILIDTENPQSMEALKQVFQALIGEVESKIYDRVCEINTEEEIWTTDEFMQKYQISSKSVLQDYHAEGLPYIKGRPNKYFKSEVHKFFKNYQITR